MSISTSKLVFVRTTFVVKVFSLFIIFTTDQQPGKCSHSFHFHLKDSLSTRNKRRSKMNHLELSARFENQHTTCHLNIHTHRDTLTHANIRRSEMWMDCLSIHDARCTRWWCSCSCENGKKRKVCENDSAKSFAANAPVCVLLVAVKVNRQKWKMKKSQRHEAWRWKTKNINAGSCTVCSSLGEGKSPKVKSV